MCFTNHHHLDRMANYLLFKRNKDRKSTPVVCDWSVSDKRIYRQECIPVGCIPSAAVAVFWRGVYSGGVVCSWGWVCSGGECLLWGWGVCFGGGLLRGGGWWWYPSMHWGRPPRGQTDRCKNITFATSLQTVTNRHLCFVLIKIKYMNSFSRNE